MNDFSAELNLIMYIVWEIIFKLCLRIVSSRYLKDFEGGDKSRMHLVGI